MSKQKTVNVIEYFNDTIQNPHAFEDNPQGNKDAEELFRKIAKGQLDGWQLFLVHSS